MLEHATLWCLVSYFRSTTSHESGIAWLEKELHSLQREKQKLEREKEKYLDREQRLEKIRTAMRNQQQKEITVKTSNGEEFKFGGISENFTRKLFEWEERRNIAPESSTIGETPSRKVFQEFSKNSKSLYVNDCTDITRLFEMAKNTAA